jgi:hypothetical protein
VGAGFMVGTPFQTPENLLEDLRFIEELEPESETFPAVSIMIVNDSDGKFSSSDAQSFATNYAGLISSNPSNTSFTPSTNNGSITISRSDVMTTDEMSAAMSGGDYSIMQTIKYMLMIK